MDWILLIHIAMHIASTVKGILESVGVTDVTK